MTQQELFDHITNAYTSQRAFAMCRYPATTTIKAYVLRDELTSGPLPNDFSGFIMAPFDDSTSPVGFSRETCDIYSAAQVLKNYPSAVQHFQEAPGAKEAHISLVEKGVQFLREKGNKKVVLSRQIQRTVGQFDFLEAFTKLLRYSNAFVYCWYHPEKGMWMGATPETLIRVEQKEFFTMALAGTVGYKEGDPIVWGDKEIHEQRVVTEYIKAQLAELPLEVSDPYTVRAGNVAHIRTDLRGNLHDRFKLETLIDRLHPTPAVCGIPVALSKKFIFREEAFSRDFYTGYLGEYQVENRTKLFVNLRCMRIQKDQATIFVGGGITAGSIPALEWQETCEKAKLMLGLLGA